MMFLNKLAAVRSFVFDVDGVLTNGLVLVNETGAELRQFNIRDGFALEKTANLGYPMAIITGGSGQGIKLRLEKLGIQHIYLGVKDKATILTQFALENNLSLQNMLYMGDDLPDLNAMGLVGLSVCPADAVPEIKNIVTYISSNKGGEGCVRDVLEKVLKAQGKW